MSGGNITQSFSTARVLGSTDGGVGGLVGENAGYIYNSYATGAVSGSPLNFTFPVTIDGVTYQPCGQCTSGAGGLVGINDAQISGTYATGAVSGTLTAGGLVGQHSVFFPPPPTSSYWDTQTTGQPTSAGGVGLTTAQLQSGMLPAGFDPAVWTATPGQYPALIGLGGQVLAQFVLPPIPAQTPPITSYPSQIELFSNQAASFFQTFENAAAQAGSAVANFFAAIGSDISNAAQAVGCAIFSGNQCFSSTLKDHLSDASLYAGIASNTLLGTQVVLNISDPVKLFFAAVKTVEQTPQFQNSAPLSVRLGVNALISADSLATSCIGALVEEGVDPAIDAGCALSALGTTIGAASMTFATLAKDPPDLNYQQAFVPSAPPSSGVSLPGCPSTLLSDVNSALTWLNATSVTVNRYGTALENNDATSAGLQYMAYLEYLGQYASAAQTLSGELGCLGNVIQAFGGQPLSQQDLSDALNYLQEDATSSPMFLNYFEDLGYNLNDIQSLINDVLINPPSLSSEDPIVALTNAASAFAATTGETTAVSERTSLLVLFSGLLFLLPLQLGRKWWWSK